MARRLKQRYPKYAEYWRMDAEPCRNSSPSVPLSDDERRAELKAVSEIGLSEGGRGNESGKTGRVPGGSADGDGGDLKKGLWK